jgi:hypothetical protein
MNHRTVPLAAAAFLCLGDVARGQCLAATPISGSVTLANGNSIAPPQGGWPNTAASFHFSAIGSPQQADPFLPTGTVAPGAAAITLTDVQKTRTLQDALGDPSAPQLVVSATGAPPAQCWIYTVTLPPGQQQTRTPDPNVPIESRGYGANDCRVAGQAWRALVRADLRTGSQGDPFTVLLFRRNGTLCYSNRDYGIQGQPIYVGAFVAQATQWDEVAVTYDPCSLAPTEPSILVSGDITKIGSGSSSGVIYHVRTFPERSCYNPSVVVGVKGPLTSGTTTLSTVDFRHTVQQYQRYRATLQFGILNTPQHFNTFGLRDSSGTKLIFDQGPVNRGPEYVASLVLYGLPHYLSNLLGDGPVYEGRDILHDQSLSDRIGGVIGASINSPGKRFLAGFSLEAIYGVNVFGVWDVAQLQQLVGVSEGDPWTAALNELPVRKYWSTKFVTGLSFDLSYAGKLLGTRP